MFDFENVEENAFAPLPEGTYSVFVDRGEWKDSNAGPQYLNLMFKVFEGELEGKTFWSMYHVNNANETCRNIALGNIKSLLKASGITNFKFETPEALLGALLECRCEVTTKIVLNDEFGDKTEVKKYKPLVEGKNVSGESAPF